MVRTLPAPAAAPGRRCGRSGEDGALLAREPATIAAGDSSVAVRLGAADRAAQPHHPLELEGEDIGRRRAAARRALAPPPGRHRRAAEQPPAQPLLSEHYYLERALGPFTEVRRGRAADLLKREIAVLVYCRCRPGLGGRGSARSRNGSRHGGVLLRFAGPHIAEQSDHLLPVRLRRGDRTIGGALSWEKPAKLAPFAPESPFAGLAIPADVTVARQVLAEPDLDLADKTWARLADGTPLVTAEKLGKGWIVLVHTTANTEWSNLALSGLFVQMLRRIVAMSQGVGGGDARTRCRRSRCWTGSAGLQRGAADRPADLRQGHRHRRCRRRAIRPGSTAPPTRGGR